MPRFVALLFALLFLAAPAEAQEAPGDDATPKNVILLIPDGFGPASVTLMLQLVAFYQYNTLADLGAWNVRLSYEFRPLSYIYLVFNDARYFVSTTERMAQPDAFAPQQQFIFKLTYLA